MGCYTWESIFEAAMVFIVLVFFLDVLSAIAGVGSTLLFAPALVVLAKRFAYYRSQTAMATDSRVRHISEVIDGIASVKSYVWENPFIQLIEKYRLKEETFIAQSQILRAVNQGLIFCIPSVSACATFAVFWARGGRLSVPVIFATLSLLQVLRLSLGRLWTRSIETTSEAIASCNRLDAFLGLVEADEKQESSYRTAPTHVLPQQQVVDPNLLVEMRHCNFQYNPGDPKPTLSNIHMSIKRGELLMVVGPVGCGKSTLLLSVLNEVPGAPRSQNLHDHSSSEDGQHTYMASNVQIAYCAQKPWILADSVRANITIGRGANAVATVPQEDTEQGEVDHPDLFEMAMESCMMVEDLLQWPCYDSTELGERGISISGGQKARISLARAIYADADCMWEFLLQFLKFYF